MKNKASITTARKDMKYRVDTTSLNAKGAVPIRGINKYPGQPEVHFTREAWVKQCHLVDICPKEVGWFTLVNYNAAENVFTIYDIIIPKQTVSAAETNIGKEALADAAMELINRGEDTSRLYGWFHSHVNMSVTPSGQDEYQVEDFLEDLVEAPEVPAFIRGIQNKKGDLKLDVYFMHHGLAYQNVEFFVIHDDDPAWTDQVDALVKANVEEEKFAQWYPRSPAAGNVGSVNGSERRIPVYADDDTSEDDDVPSLRQLPAWDSTNYPTPITEPESYRWWDMDTIHTAENSNIDVLMDYNGDLYVCDNRGELYHYEDYVSYFGEIDGTDFEAALEVAAS